VTAFVPFFSESVLSVSINTKENINSNVCILFTDLLTVCHKKKVEYKPNTVLAVIFDILLLLKVHRFILSFMNNTNSQYKERKKSIEYRNKLFFIACHCLHIKHVICKWFPPIPWLAVLMLNGVILESNTYPVTACRYLGYISSIASNSFVEEEAGF